MGKTNRRHGIGGTDISAILGMNPHKTALDVWLSKTDQAPPDEDNENMWWGREMEPILAKRYEKETGLKVFVPPLDVLPYRRSFPEWYCGSPDGLINPKSAPCVPITEGGVEFKTSGRPQDWGEPETDDVPRPYLIQAEWYMGLTEAQWWDIAVLLMGFTRNFAIYRIKRDDDLIGYLQEEAERFWKDHVLTGIPPALDGSKAATEYLKRKYPLDMEPMLEPTDEDILRDIDLYHRARKDLKNNESYMLSLENRLKDFVGQASGIQGSWGKIYWRKNKDSIIVDTKAMITAHPDIAKEFTVVRPGARVWRTYFKED